MTRHTRGSYKAVGVLWERDQGALDQAVRILARAVHERSSVGIVTHNKGPFTLCLETDTGLPSEGYELRASGSDTLRIAGGGKRGILYGIGRFLREADFSETEIAPGGWTGASAPDKAVRGIYFATHFYNWYHVAPVEEVVRYVEDLALWGYNSLNVWFDMHHYDGSDDPAARAMLERLRDILAGARRAGLKSGIGVLANEAYRTSPESMRAAGTGRAHYGVEVCPNQPGAKELVLKGLDDELAAFSSVGIDTFWIWPYDQGGCGCEACRPWGANGYLDLAEPVARRVKQVFPSARIVLSTWLFDYGQPQGEWEGLSRRFRKRPEWVDYVLADSHGDEFPRYPLDHGVPGGLPLLNFPEISMFGMSPWGGFGANPLPCRFEKIWRPIRDAVSGGFPYSEGRFEDLNKAVMASFYWNRETRAQDAVRAYAAGMFSPVVAEDVAEAVAILERNHRHVWVDENGYCRRTQQGGFDGMHCRRIEKAFRGQDRYLAVEAEDSGAERAWQLMREADTRLCHAVRAGWRWRVLYLRALIDAELFAHPDTVTSPVWEAFAELTDLYRAGKCRFRPPRME